MSLPTLCATCRRPLADPNRSVCEDCFPTVEHVAERNRLAEENDRLRESVAWWQRVAEAKQVERDTIRAALEMIAQVRHVSGSAQAARRNDLRIADAALLGADMRDLATVEAVVAGTWSPTA